jgi:aspartate/tyrosine/aromatic aminotransferase
MFEAVQAAPPDPILGLTEAFKEDAHPGKVNLGVGVYMDDAGKTPILRAVKAAEAASLALQETKSYMPIGGDPVYGRCVEGLAFGASAATAAASRIRTAHTPGGTGALRVGADFYRHAAPTASVWISKPSWPNHRGLFTAAGFGVKEYPYYDPARRAVDVDALLGALRQVPAGDLVLLHACCHNPTGADLNDDTWRAITELARAGGWTPFLDAAYLGLGDGLDEDASALRIFLDAGIDFMAALSFSKNMGLYCDRVGALTLVAGNAKAADAAFSQVKRAVRVLYSNPSAHGGLIARKILEDASLRDVWHRELTAMRERIATVRAQFVEQLSHRQVPMDLSAIERQKGMFSLTGISAAQIAWLKEKHGVYVVGDSRVNVAGLTSSNLPYVCESFAEALKHA